MSAERLSGAELGDLKNGSGKEAPHSVAICFVGHGMGWEAHMVAEPLAVSSRKCGVD